MKIKNYEKIFLCRMEDEKALTERETDFIEYIWNAHCIYYSHQDEKDLYFYRIKSENREPYPTLHLKKNSIEILDTSETEKTVYADILFSFDKFCKARIIDEKDKALNSHVISCIRNDLDRIQNHFHTDGKNDNVSVILTNEGTGKSKMVLDQIKKGEIYTAPDKEILTEKEKYLTMLKKDFVRFYSNADIIYTTISSYRNNEIAKKISSDYLEQCKHMDRNFDSNILSDELKEISTKELPYIIEEISNITNNDIEYTPENSSISLIRFLKENTEIEPEEKNIIIEYYNYLISILIKGTKIVTCTTHKLRILLEKIKYKRKLLVYSDEIINDVHGNAQILNKNIIESKTYNFISMATRLKERVDSDEAPGNVLKKLDKLKKKRNVHDWFTISSYNGFHSLVEIKENNWMFNNRAVYIILTTEEKSKIIFPDAVFYDYRHEIFDNDINIICIDQFNSSIQDEKIFKGHERPLIVKSCAETIFNIKPEFYIGNGIGHSLKNNLPNIHNIRGTNTIFNNLKNEKDKNIGIAITSPHPETINLHKGLFYGSNIEMKEKKLQSIDCALQKEQDNIISIIINDQLHQSIGRVHGYRKIDNNKTYIFITSQLLSKLKPYYVTKNIFHLSNFLNQKYFRELYPDIFKFLVSVNLLLNLKRDKNNNIRLRNHKEEPPDLNNYLLTILEKFKLKIDETFFTRLMKKIFDYCKSFLQMIKEQNNKIKYIFSLITALTKKYLIRLKLHHMDFLFLKKSNIIEKRKIIQPPQKSGGLNGKNFNDLHKDLLNILFHNSKIIYLE